MKQTFRRILAVFPVACLTLLLAACGGGTKDSASGGVGTNPSVTSTVLSLRLELRDQANQPVTRLTVGQKVTVVATVKQTVTASSPSGPYTSTSPAPGVKVTLETTGGTLIPPSGSVMTDEKGIARAQLEVGNTAGALILHGAADALNATGATAELVYSVDQVLVGGIELRVLDAQGRVMEVLRAGDIYTVEAKVTHVLQDISNPGAPGTREPLAGAEVTMASDGGIFDPTSGKALTDEHGYAHIRFEAALRNDVTSMAATAQIDGTVVTQANTYEIRLPTLRLGSGTPFAAGVLALDPARIDSTGQVVVSGKILDQDDRPFTTPVEVAFTSACAGTGAAVMATPALSRDGGVSTTYRATGCVGTDVIHARLQLPGQTVPTVAEAALTVDPPASYGLIFDGLEHAIIATRGNGGPGVAETSQVTFRAADAVGNPMPGVALAAHLAGSAADAGVLPASTATGADGSAVVTVRSGMATGVVRVVVTNQATGAQAQSAPIAISNGRPTHGALSLSLAKLNMEAAEVDGVTNDVVVRLADRLGNPVPDGTAVRFTTEGGSIAPACTTMDGACTVALVAQAPRPANGRVTILATTVGDEAFTDTNGNGRYDLYEPFVDIGEAFRDDNENGKYDPGEWFEDSNGNGRWDGPNGRYDGAACASGCGADAITLSASGVVLFTTSQAHVTITPNPVTLHPAETAVVNVLVSDLQGNMMAGGTTLDISAVGAEVVNQDEQYEILDTNAPGPYVARVVLKGTEIGNGTLTVRVTSPSGRQTTASGSIRTIPAAEPTAAAKYSPVRTMRVSPHTIELAPGGGRSVPVRVLLTEGGGAASRAAYGATPSIKCDDMDTGIVLQVAGDVRPTDAQGVTVVTVVASAGSRLGVTARCVLTAGAATETITAIVPGG